MTPRSLAWSIIVIWSCSIPLLCGGHPWAASGCLVLGMLGLAGWLLVTVVRGIRPDGEQ